MEVLDAILLALHMVAVNVATAVPLVCVWLHARGRRGDATADQTGRRLAWVSLYALLAGIGIGALLVGPAWWDQSTGYWQAVGRFPPRAYGFAALELVFSLVCLWIYARMWDLWRAKPWLHGLVAVMSATNLLYHFPPLMVVLGELSAHPRIATDATIMHEDFRQLMMRSDVLSYVVHFTVASIAMGGWTLMAVAYKSRESRVESREPKNGGGGFDRLISAGAWIALAASLAQLAVGLWVLVEMPIVTRNLLLGSNWLATGLFFVSIVATFALLHLLASVALGDTSDAAIRRSTLMMLVIILLMVGVLVRVRRLEVRNPAAEMLVTGMAAAERDHQTPATGKLTKRPVPSLPHLRSRRHLSPSRAALS